MGVLARHTRIHYPGAIYHIIARGNNRESIFRQIEDKARYLALIDKYKQKYKFCLYAYTLMDNHVHLLGAVDQDPVGKFMQGVQQSYTQYFNHKYNRVGHIFEQRFKAKLCNNEPYILNLLRYIHLNPVRAGITSTPCYRWSSHYIYQEGKIGLADPSFLLAFFSANNGIARQIYMEFMNRAEDSKEEDIEKAYYLDTMEVPCEVSNGVMDVMPKVTFERLLELISTKTGIASEQILRERYNRQVAEARDTLIYAASRAGMTKTQLSKVLPLSVAGVIKGFNRVVINEKLKDCAEQMLVK